MKRVLLFVLLACSLISSTLFAAEKDPVVVWSRSYDSGAGDEARAIAVDAQGNAYATGFSDNGGLNDYFRTIKYNSSGDTVYNIIPIILTTDCRAHGVAVDAFGNAFIAGYIDGVANHDFITKGYDSNKSIIFSQSYNSNQADEANAITIDASGYLYVAGFSYNGATNDFRIIKYNSSNGDTTLNLVYDSSGIDIVNAITVDSSRNIYIAGNSGNDYRTIKYNSSGETVWNKTYDSGNTDIAYGVATDAQGNVYVVGTSNDGVTDNVRLIKYDSSGNVVWNKIYDSGSTDAGRAIAVDLYGNIYVAGNSGIANRDIRIIKYNPDGTIIWNISYDSGNHDDAFGIAVDNLGNLFIAGRSWGTGNFDFRIIKYKLQYDDVVPPTTSGEVKIGSSGGDGIAHPGENVVIRFKPTEAGKVTVKIYTLSGMLVKELPVYDSAGPNDYNNIISWACDNDGGSKVSSGIYVINIQGPGINFIRKAAVVR